MTPYSYACNLLVTNPRITMTHDDSDSFKAFVHKEQYKEFANDVPSLEKPFQCTECNKVKTKEIYI